MSILIQYQQKVSDLMAGDEVAWALGLAGEVGEVVELVKKKHYHQGADKKGPITTERILDELGDVLWYLTAMLIQHGESLHHCMMKNMQKLEARFPSGYFKSEEAHRQADYHRETP